MPKQEQPQEPDKFTASKNPRKLGDSAAFGEMLARVRATKTASVRTFADSPPGPASVNALAAALQNNVDLIYEWVYNNVDYSPIYGSWKGDLGTLIDRSGGTVDQANLFWSLLTQADINNPTAGYNPQFVFGTANFTASQLENLLGTTDSAAAYPNTPSYNLLMQGIFGPERVRPVLAC